MKINPVYVLGAVAGTSAAFFAYRAYKSGAGIAGAVVAGVKQTVAQAGAQVQHVVNTSSSAFDRGQAFMSGETVPLTTRQALYSNAGYAGLDPATGQPVGAGEWYANPDAMRYDYGQRQAGYVPPATTINGAAFGVYPKALPPVFASTTLNADARRQAWLLDQAIVQQQESTGGATGTW